MLSDAELPEIAGALEMLQQNFSVDAAATGDTWYLETDRNNLYWDVPECPATGVYTNERVSFFCMKLV